MYRFFDFINSIKSILEYINSDYLLIVTSLIILGIFVAMIITITIMTLLIKHYKKTILKEKENAEIAIASARSEASITISKIKSEASAEILKTKSEADEQVLSAKNYAEQTIEEEKVRSSQALKELSEMIETRKTVLSDMPDKDLLIEVLLALDGYATRLERVERGLEATQIKTQMSELAISIESQFSETEEEIATQIQSLRGDLANIVESQLYDIKDECVQQIQTQESDVSSKLSSIEFAIDELKEIISGDYNSIYSGISNVSSSVDDIKSMIQFRDN